MSSIRGWPSDRKMASTPAPHVTVEPMGKEQYGLTVRAQVFAWNAGNDLVESGSTQEFINATAHIARVGDVIRFNSGALNKEETKVIKVEPNRIYIADLLSVAPTTGDQIIIMRPRQAQVDDNGNLIVSTTSGPVQYVLNGIDTEVTEDTIAPNDSRPLPVKVFRANGTSDWADDVEAAVETTANATSAMATDIDALESNFGSAAVAPAADDTGTFVFMAFVKRILQRLTLLVTSNAAIAVDTTAIATNTSAIGAQLPATIGRKAMAASLSVTMASDQPALPTSGPNAVISTANSTTTPLGVSGVFTGTWEDVANYAAVTVAIYANQATATNGFQIQQSGDGVNADIIDTYTFPAMAAGAGKTVSFSPQARYFRIVLTNNTVAQTILRMQTIFRYIFAKPSNHSLAETITLQNDAQLMIAQLRATTGTNSVAVGADGTNLCVSLVNINGSAMATGNGAANTGTQRVSVASDSLIGTVAPAAATVKSAAITVGLTAIRCTHDGAAPTAGRRKLSFRLDPDATGKVYYGSSAVTVLGATRGILVFPGESVDMVNDAGDYYLISDTASQTVFIVEQE